MEKSRVEKFAKSKGWDGVGEKTRWNDYDVYELKMDAKKGETVYVGYPLVVLVKGEKMRISTPSESLQFLRFKYPEDYQDDEIDPEKQ